MFFEFFNIAIEEIIGDLTSQLQSGENILCFIKLRKFFVFGTDLGLFNYYHVTYVLIIYVNVRIKIETLTMKIGIISIKVELKHYFVRKLFI